MSESKKYELNKRDLGKILKGLGIAAGGAVITELTAILPTVDFGPYKAVAMVIFSVLVNVFYKLSKGK